MVGDIESVLLMQGASERRQSRLPFSEDQPTLNAGNEPTRVPRELVSEVVKLDLGPDALGLLSFDGLSGSDMGNHMTVILFRNSQRCIPPDLGLRAQVGIAGNGRKKNFHRSWLVAFVRLLQKHVCGSLPFHRSIASRSK